MSTVDFDGIEYPAIWQGILKDSTLLKVFKTYAKKAAIHEMVVFLGYPIDPSKHYAVFIDPRGAVPMNLPDAIRRPMMELWQAGDYGRSSDWPRHIARAKTHVTDMLEIEYLEGRGGYFWKSDVFRKYHAIVLEKQSARAAVGTKTFDRKKLILCGFSTPADPRIQARLGEMAAARDEGREADAGKAWTAVQKLEPKESDIRTTDYRDAVKTMKRLKLVA